VVCLKHHYRLIFVLFAERLFLHFYVCIPWLLGILLTLVLIILFITAPHLTVVTSVPWLISFGPFDSLTGDMVKPFLSFISAISGPLKQTSGCTKMCGKGREARISSGQMDWYEDQWGCKDRRDRK